MSQNMETTKEWLDIITVAQSFGILLVVLGHSYAIGVPRPFLYEWLYKIIYSFHMPLFFFVSGFLLCYAKGYKDSFIRILEKKSARLLIPYLALSSLAFLPKVILSQYSMRKTELILSSFLINVFYPLDNVLGHFWFIPTLFILLTIVTCMIKIFNKSVNWVFLTTAAVIMICTMNYHYVITIKLFNLSGVLNHLPFFWAGFLVAYYPDPFRWFIMKKLCFPVTLGLLLCFCNGGIRVPCAGLLTALIGITMVFSFGNLYLNYRWKAFRYIDGLSYQIFLLSWPMQAVINIITYKMLGLGWYPTFLCMLVVGLVGPVVVTKIFTQYRMPGRAILGIRGYIL